MPSSLTSAKGAPKGPPDVSPRKARQTMISIHESAQVSQLADIEDSVRGSLIEIGPETQIDSFVKIKPAGGDGDA